MEKKKLSSIEWLIEQLEEKGKAWENVSIGRLNISIDVSDYMELKHQAKAMHKEEVVNTWTEATAPTHEIGLSDTTYILAQIKKAEQYYTNTFGGNNE